MRVDFYHLTTRPLDRVLPQIAAKVLADGGRLLIVAGEESQRAGLDRSLWTYSPDSFLPHGLAGAGDEASQPVLIAGDVIASNGARNVALVDGRWRDAALAFDRAFHFFDEDHIQAARLAWNALGKHDGAERNYWRQKEEGGWERVA